MQIAQTERLTLRLLQPDDAALILTLLNQPSFLTHIGDKGVRDLAGALNYIETGPLAMQQQRGYSLYCCQLNDSGEAIGLCGLIKREGVEHAELGFSLLETYQGKGLGKEAAQATLQHARTVLGLPVLQAIVSPTNPISRNLLLSVGFTAKGKVTPVGMETVDLYQITWPTA